MSNESTLNCCFNHILTFIYLFIGSPADFPPLVYFLNVLKRKILTDLEQSGQNADDQIIDLTNLVWCSLKADQ